MFNVEEYLADAFESVRAQTYGNWELLAVDDCSTDGTLAEAERLASTDDRIRVLRHKRNSGAAVARNTALGAARGRYIAYLDPDDMWMPDKLSKQIGYMNEHAYGAVLGGFETINSNGTHRNYVRPDARYTLHRFLTKPPTATSTIIFDTNLVDRDLLVMPDLRKGQDAATWIQVIKGYGPLRGMKDIVSCYRKREGSLSSNKLGAIQRTWNLYVNEVGLSKLYATYCMGWYSVHAVLKRLGKTK